MDGSDIDKERAREFADIWRRARNAIRPNKAEIYTRWKKENAHTRCFPDTHLCTNQCTLVCPFEESGDTDLFVCIGSHNLHRCNAQECDYSAQNNDHSRSCRVRGVTWFDTYRAAESNARFDAHEMQTMLNVTKTASSNAFQRAMCGMAPRNHKRVSLPKQRRAAKAKRTKAKHVPYKCKPDEIHKIGQLILSLFWSEERQAAQCERADKLDENIDKDDAALCTLAKRTQTPIYSIRRQEACFGRYKAAQKQQSKRPEYDAIGQTIHEWLARTVGFAYERYKDYVSILKQHKDKLELEALKVTAIRARVKLSEFVLRFIEAMREVSICHRDEGRIIINGESWIDKHMPRHSEFVRIFPEHEKMCMKRTQIRLILNIARDLHEIHPFPNGPPSLSTMSLFGKPPPLSVDMETRTVLAPIHTTSTVTATTTSTTHTFSSMEGYQWS